jgi:hypothetical protein
MAHQDTEERKTALCEDCTSMGSASMSVLSANFGSPFPMVAKIPVSAIGCW